ncbi:hypothetical protein IS481_12055 [Caldimonas thermodepolymerans]|uniref:Uncharacterized protein n=1 Tax=Caldimonas thermodepolymerans TaxID=215580 RepID=A0A2S5T950_9BURK|nr:hypothetical protein [Caldimonas thermodepolymerans]PPE71476.1 hypothetical protein C1702_00280 [Caldimonas thermodepolymerans]QPC30503.1 hypothetical protein IS481_12055 [Caldimonas thermodepolymerans]RDI02911.1 hypothetical protein DES46_102339 [Caldimonas thermodepolymerans]
MDTLLQPRIGALYQGVSRQAPLMRAPNQFEDLVNFLPAVDVGGAVDRPGTALVQSLVKANYAAGPHHFFRTTDGRRWVLLRGAAPSTLEVRNWDTGEVATLNMHPNVWSYLAAGTGDLKFLTISDTTLILNPAVTVTATESARPTLTVAYLVIRSVSSAKQAFIVSREAGPSATMALSNGNTSTRETVATSLANAINSTSALGLGASTLGNAPYIIKLTGSAAAIEMVMARNDWDGGAVTLIKGRVNSTADLPPAFEEGYPIAVDLAQGDRKSTFYVRFDLAKNAWIETSYLAHDAATATLNASTMPLRLRLSGANEFTLETCPWNPRTRGDSDSNPLPYFVGKRITALAHWKGRLLTACEDTIYTSQADDLFNFWRETAREVRASDPVKLPADAPGISVIRHIVPFRNKLIVTSDNAQLEVPGDQPFKPDTATMSVATRYNLDKDCTPVVVGDCLYYTGPFEGRAALWEYYYDDSAASNTAFDLSKHVPGFIPGKVRKIDGSAETGRVIVWTPQAPTALFVHTSYWTNGRREQNAWTRLEFPGVSAIWDFWVDADHLCIAAVSNTRLWLLQLPLEANLDGDVRLDFQSRATSVVWDAERVRVPLPAGLHETAGLVFAVPVEGGWFAEYTGTVVMVGSNRFLEIQAPLGETEGILGTRFPRSFTFSPFYPSIEELPTPMGRLQVRQVVLDMLRTGDLTATLKRKDRSPDLVVTRSPRVLGEHATQPIVGENVQVRIPFNSRGDAASLTVTATSTVPTAITGYTLLARYTNPLR